MPPLHHLHQAKHEEGFLICVLFCADAWIHSLLEPLLELLAGLLALSLLKPRSLLLEDGLLVSALGARVLHLLTNKAQVLRILVIRSLRRQGPHIVHQALESTRNVLWPMHSGPPRASRG